MRIWPGTFGYLAHRVSHICVVELVLGKIGTRARRSAPERVNIKTIMRRSFRCRPKRPNDHKRGECRSGVEADVVTECPRANLRKIARQELCADSRCNKCRRQ